MTGKPQFRCSLSPIMMNPTLNTRSRTAQLNITDLTPQPKTDTVTADITEVTDTPDAMPKPLTKDRIHALLQSTDPFLSVSPSIYHTEKFQNIRLISFYTSNVYCTSTLWTQTRSSRLLSYQKFGKYTVLVEVHEKLGHQIVTHTYWLIKCQYYWKGMNKDIRKYIANCTLCCREKPRFNLTLCK